MMETLTTRVDKPDAVLTRSMVVAIVAFLTLIDLFGAQALLPTIAAHYHASPVEVGIAVNASTIGMAASGLLLAFIGNRIERRTGIWVSLLLLSIPTLLLGFADDLRTFTALRVCQGIFMAAAFTLTLSYLSGICTHTAARGAMAAYITGNVASNVLGRLLASGVASSAGLAETFYVFSALNILGAVIAYGYFRGMERMPRSRSAGSGDILHVVRQKVLLSCFAIGFVILFVFVGVFTYINFILTAAPFSLDQQRLGFVYLVFIPSMLTTPSAALIATKLGVRTAFVSGILISIAGVVLLLSSSLIAILSGLTAIGIGLFLAQAVVTGFVGYAAQGSAATANALYLASYYLGGVAGASVLGLVFVAYGWTATVAVMCGALVVAALLGTMMTSGD